jgi:hypothetical protein
MYVGTYMQDEMNCNSTTVHTSYVIKVVRTKWRGHGRHLFTESTANAKITNEMCVTCIPTHLAISIFWPLSRLRNVYRSRREHFVRGYRLR